MGSSSGWWHEAGRPAVAPAAFNHSLQRPNWTLASTHAPDTHQISSRLGSCGRGAGGAGWGGAAPAMLQL